MSRPSNCDAPAGRAHEAEQRAAERGLAAARLADEPEHLALAGGRTRRRSPPAPTRPRGRPAGRRSCRGSSSTSCRSRTETSGSGFVCNARAPRARARRSRPAGSPTPARAASTGRGGRAPGATSIGCFRAHTRIASGQRGWKRQPAGGSIRFGGAPGIECSSVVSSEIVERSSSRVYGCAGSAKTSRAGPFSTIFPAYMTATRSQASATIPRLCVIRSSAVPKLRFRSARIARICASTITSSEVVGSSATSSFGRRTSASAIMIRCRIPPENSCGYWRKRVGGMPIRPSVSSERCADLAVAQARARAARASP